MSEERIDNPEAEQPIKVDPPTNTEEVASSMSAHDSAEALPVDPPQNTSLPVDPPQNT